MVHKHQKFIVELLSIGSLDQKGSYELTGGIMSLETAIAFKIFCNVSEICSFFSESSRSITGTAVGMIKSRLL